MLSQEASPFKPPIEQTVIAPSRTFFSIPVRDLWRYRELLVFLVWRDLKVRYKQTALGAAWIILQPLINMVIFSLLFGGLLKVPSGKVAYPVFALAALVPWNYFSSSLTKASTSLVNNVNMITKVYFPRLIIPISGVLSGLVDFLISFVLLLLLIAYYRVQLTPAMLLLPVLVVLAVGAALGFSLWLSALNVRFRDVNYLVPFLVQAWMYVTPVIYSTTLIPERYRFLLALNPMTGVVEGFRWALLGDQLANVQPPVQVILVSAAITLLVLVSGLLFFRNMERTFADII